MIAVERERRLLWALGLGFFVFLTELLAGVVWGSLALLADSAHVFLDVVALGLAYLGARLARRPPTARYTYGFRRVEVLTAAVNGLTLLLLLGLVAKEAFARLRQPLPVPAGPMLGVALAGLLANLLMAGLLRAHEEADLNLRAAFLHVLGDALGSLAALAAGLVILLTGWTAADTVASLGIAALVAVGAVRVLRRAFRILAEGVPEGLDPERIAQRLLAVPGVRDVHDLHLWSIGPGFPALSAHVQVESQTLAEADALAAQLRRLLREEFGLAHVTLQLEGSSCGAPCCNGVSRGP
ncbi:MAG: cation diffusion facilitator family transporter [Candidatus Bipolaricaulota bacterium]|nr:cation diffusion facilitator family transporter [Candidatus Bipolaricaulota bacterium]MDW8151857.1 cation diffusion facilitator family transporter [Candidatus Bipolaricaulota bacterium]